ncbi:MAG: hypothetical protein ABIH35_01595 [Patescibacteria group bacterium]
MSHPPENLGIKRRPQTLAERGLGEIREDFERAKDFLAKHVEFEHTMNGKIDSLSNTPTREPQKRIFENSILMLKRAFKDSLIASSSRESSERGQAAAAEKLSDSWTKALRKMSGPDGTLEYHDLLPSNPYAPEVTGLLGDFKFLREFDELAKRENKKGFVSLYLKKWAAKTVAAGEVDKESAVRFAEEAYAVLLRSVGEEHLDKAKFEDLWKQEVLKDSTVAKLWAAAAGTKAGEKFEKLLFDGEDKKIVSLRRKEIKLEHDRAQAAAFNPHGFEARTYGSLFSAMLYGGEKILYGIILVNFALCGFNPMKMIQSPVLWATAGGVLAITKYYKPDFMSGKPEVSKAARADLETALLGVEDRSPTVWAWLTKFSKADLSEKGAVGKLLTAKEERGEITSVELAKVLPADEHPGEKLNIAPRSPEAGQLYRLLKLCRDNKINPKGLENA